MLLCFVEINANDEEKLRLIFEMDLVNRKPINPTKRRLAHTFAKFLNIQKSKPQERIKNDGLININPQLTDEDDEKKLHQSALTEAFLAKLFSSISAIKAAYAQLQFSQSPYDPDGIQSSDQMVVSELKSLSELKQCYLKKQFDESSLVEKTLFLAEIKEQKSLLKMYEITGKKLDYEIRLKNSEIMFLREKLEEANRENKMVEKRLNSSGQLRGFFDNLQVWGLCPNHFMAVLKQTIKSIRSFVWLMIDEMESCKWDLDSAASSIESGIVYFNSNHKCFVFESFVCRVMFDGFNHPNFSLPNASLLDQKNRQKLFFENFMEFKSIKPRNILISRHPKSSFATFCRDKYLKLVHPIMESSFFGDLNQRSLVSSGEYPETTFFDTFVEMAWRVWLLHCLAFAFNPEVSIFQVRKGSRFSEVYMKSLSNEANLACDQPQVAFMVVPGFKIGKTVIQCQVYLS